MSGLGPEEQSQTLTHKDPAACTEKGGGVKGNGCLGLHLLVFVYSLVVIRPAGNRPQRNFCSEERDCHGDQTWGLLSWLRAELSSLLYGGSIGTCSCSLLGSLSTKGKLRYRIGGVSAVLQTSDQALHNPKRSLSQGTLLSSHPSHWHTQAGALDRVPDNE